MNVRMTALLGSAAAVACYLPSSALAQSVGSTNSSPSNETAAANVGEIVVTAQRRAERQVDVPISITTLSARQLAVANVQNLADIAQVTPSLRFDNQAGFVQPSIRGIGTGTATSGGGSNVGIYIDGFYSPNPVAADFQLTKVTGIQVLKGPQGTLFGRNTTGGAILVTTADPSTTPEFDAKVSYGSFNAQKYQAYGTVGLTDRVAVDLEGILSKGDGFLTNIVNGDNKVGAYQNWTVRAGVKAEVTDKVSVLARYTHSRSDDPSGLLLNSNTDTTIDPTTGKPWGVQTYTTYPFTATPAPYTTNPNQVAVAVPRFIRTDTDIGQLTIKADLGFANLTSYTQYRAENTDQSEQLFQIGLGGLTGFQIGIPVKDKTFSQEFLLSSKPGTRLQWTTGLFYLSNQDTWVTTIDNFYPTRFRLGGSGTTTETFAAFVDGTYQIADKWFLTAGVRYSHDDVKDAFYNNPSSPTSKISVPSIASDAATPRLVIRYKPTDQSSVYASYSRGYKAAIIDVGGSCQDNFTNFTCNSVSPETIDAFEVGYKFASHDLSVEVAAYYDDYRNLQVSEYLGAAQAYIVNAARSKIYGIDASVHYNLGEHIQINAGGVWNHARYDTFGNSTLGAPLYASCATASPLPAGCLGGFAFTYVNTSTILHDVHMQHSPDYTANAGVRYTTGRLKTGEFSLAGNLFYTSDFYFSPSGTQFHQPGYATLGLRGEWVDPSRKYTVAVYGENVTDQRYRTEVQFNSFGVGATWSAPAVWGVEVAAKF